MLVLADNRGSAGILSIIVMMVLGVLGATFITLSSSEVNTSARYRDGIAAQYLAEAGVQQAIVELAKEPAWPGVTNVPMGSGVTAGKYTVNPGTGTKRTITSTGVVGSATRKVVLHLTLPQQAFSYPLFAGGNMNIDNNGIVNGSARSNGTITIDNNAYISQDVIAHNTSNVSDKAKVGGQVINAAGVVEVPAFDRNDYDKPGVNTINNIGINQTIPLNGTYYHYGNLLIDNNAIITGNATIYVAGDITIDNNVVMTGNFMIIAEGNLILNNNAKINKGVLYAGQSMLINNNAQITGSAVAKDTVDVDNNAIVTFNEPVVNYFGIDATQLTVNSWSNQ